jgi:hypothetical protein
LLTQVIVVDEDKMANESKAVWVLTEESHILTLIAKINDKSVKAGKGQHSVEYWCEELLSKGAIAHDRYLDADSDRRNRESYVKEMGKLIVPNGTDAVAMTAYATQVAKLQRQFKIGGTQVEVK